MKWSRVSYVAKIALFATLRRIAYDFAREIVVGVSALVLGGLFLYIFNDFINFKVLSRSAASHRVLAQGAAIIMLLMITLFIGGRLAAEKAGRGVFGRFLGSMAEDRSLIRAFLLMRATTLLVIGYGGCWLLIDRYFGVFSFQAIASIQLVLLTSLALSHFIHAPHGRAQRGPDPLISLTETIRLSPRAVLLRWRGRQMLYRNRASRLSLFIAMIFLLLTLISGQAAAPFLAPAAACLFVSIFLGAAMCLQIAEDLKCGWLEPFMGVSHRMFLTSYYMVGAILGGVFAMTAGLSCAMHHDVDWSTTIIQAFKLGAIIMVCPLLIPSLAFQLDARRPLLTVFACTLVALFIATAIYINLGGIMILPVVVYYADDYQKNRFYTSYSHR